MSPSMVPYDNDKYEALLDGLEIEEVLLSELERTSRIDSEFYKKENMLIDQILRRKRSKPVTDFFSISDGNHMSIRDEFSETGIPYYRGQDIYHTFIEESSPICIDEGTFMNSHMVRSHLKAGDILMSIVGAIVGNSSIVYSTGKATCSCKLAILRSLEKGIYPETLLVYIRTKYGQSQIQKLKRGAAQTGFLLEDFDQVIMPVFSKEFQDAVRSMIEKAYNATIDANALYGFMDVKLMETIGFVSEPTQRLIVSQKSIQDSYYLAGRFDAEFFQSKYDMYTETLDKYKNGCSTIGEEFDLVQNKCSRTQDSYKYVEIGDVNISTGTVVFNDIPVDQLPDNAKIMTKKGDLLVSTVRPNRGAVAILDDDDLLVSGAFTVLREKTGYKKEVLQVLLRTKLYRDWLLRYNVGTSYPVIKDDNVLSMRIPILAENTQNEILKAFTQVKELRYRIAKLLDQAEEAVEMAIEQGEAVAFAWLKDRVGV